MHLLFEFLPLILFLVAFYLKDIYAAVAVLMIAMPIGFAIKYFRTRTVDKMYLWSTVFLLLAGAATLYFRNPKFLYWKPTVFYWVVGGVFLVSTWAGDRPLVRRFFEMTGELPTSNLTAELWRRLNLVWVLFFACMGLVNIYVAYNYSEAVWANFKVFGLLGLTLVFMLAQGAWLFSRLDTDTAGEKDA